jgi:hypothetical protein
MTDLRGKYKILREAFIRQKASTFDDPTHIFYQAMLKHDTYDAYLADVGTKTIYRPDYKHKNGHTDGRDEILYCRRNGRIIDA